MAQQDILNEAIAGYGRRVANLLASFDWAPVVRMASDFHSLRERGGQLFVCGNGGSAANAVHWGNDFLYPITRNDGGPGIRVHALTANEAVTTCLGNDLGYDVVFSHQLRTFARTGDLLVVLSGSGNSRNIISALEEARRLDVRSYAIVGFDGGKAKGLADVAIHAPIDDMQAAEDFQMVVCHALVHALLTQPFSPAAA